MDNRERVDLSKGGVCALVLGQGAVIPPEYSKQDQPQLVVIDSTHPDLDPRKTILPSNTKIAVLTENIPRLAHSVIHAECRNRGIVWIVRKSTGGIKQYLDSVFQASANGYHGPIDVEGEIPTDSPHNRGQIKKLIESDADFSSGRSTAEEGRRLFRIAQERGIRTTLGSVTQAISKYRRDKSLGERPKSAMSERLVALKTLDDAINGLTALRDYVSKTEAENDSLRAQVANIRKSLGVN